MQKKESIPGIYRELLSSLNLMMYFLSVDDYEKSERFRKLADKTISIISAHNVLQSNML